MGYFGNKTYGQKERKFIGKPLEQIAEANKIISDRYEKVKQGKRDLEASVEAIRSKVEDEDKPYVDEALTTIGSEFKNIISNDEYERAGDVLRNSIEGINKNLMLKETQSKKAARLAYEEELKKRIKNSDGKGGINADTANAFIAMARAKNNKKMYVDDKGVVHNRFNAPAPVDDINWTDKITDLINKYISTRGTNSNAGSVTSKDADGNYIRYMNERSRTGADRASIYNMTKQYLENTPEYQSWLKQQADIKTFNDLQHDSNGNLIYDDKGDLSYVYTNMKENFSKEGTLENSIFKSYTSHIDNNKKLTKDKKLKEKQIILDRLVDSENKGELHNRYKDIITNNATNDLVNYATTWHNDAIQNKISEVDWKYGTSGGGNKVPTNAVVAANDTGVFSVKAKDAKDRMVKKQELESKINNIRAELKKPNLDARLRLTYEEALKKTNQELDAVTSYMKLDAKQMKNTSSDSYIEDIWQNVVASKNGTIYYGIHNDEDTEKIFAKYRNILNYYNTNLKNKKIDNNQYNNYINKLKDNFSSDIYNIAMSKFNDGTVTGKLKSIKTDIGMGLSTATNFLTGKGIPGKQYNVYEKLWGAAYYANQKKINNGTNKIKNAKVLGVSNDVSEDQKHIINKSNDAAKQLILAGDATITGTDISLAKYIADDNNKFYYLDNSGKQVESKVDPAKCEVNMNETSAFGEAGYTMVLRDSQGRILTTKESNVSDKDDPRYGKIIVQLSDNNQARKLQYDAGKALINGKHNELGFTTMANANFGSVAGAGLEYIGQGETRFIESSPVDGTNRNYRILVVGEGDTYTDDNNSKQPAFRAYLLNGDKKIPLKYSGDNPNSELPSLLNSDQELISIMQMFHSQTLNIK